MVLLPAQADQAVGYARLCDGFLFSGGMDPDVREFGQPLYPRARLIHPDRQAFELALLEAIRKNGKPALGVCLGMQMMALYAGGRLDQYMPETHPDAAIHQDNRRHDITVTVTGSVLGATAGSSLGSVVSYHQQCVDHAGHMRVIARAPDGVVEAIDNPDRDFYVGVQWHPERSEDDNALNQGLIARLVEAAALNQRSATAWP